MTVSLIYDAIFILALIVLFCIYYKRGFVSSLLRLLGFVAAAVAGWFAGKRLAPVLYEQFAQARLTEFVAAKLAEFRDGTLSSLDSSTIGKVIRGFTEGMTTPLADADLTETAQSIVSGSLEGVVTTVIRVVLFVVVFLVASLLLKLLARAFRHLNDAPVLGFANQLLGGLLGLLIGVFGAYLVAAGMSAILGVWQNDLFNPEVIEQSKVFSLIFRLNPFYT